MFHLKHVHVCAEVGSRMRTRYFTYIYTLECERREGLGLVKRSSSVESCLLCKLVASFLSSFRAS